MTSSVAHTDIQSDILRMSIVTPEGDKQVTYQHWYNKPAVESQPNAPLLFCVHGLTRNRHDFDMIAEVLAHRYQVITLDILGRGDSDRMSDPSLYGYPLYVSQCLQMIQFWLDKTDTKTVHWLGTSMGGLIGMMLASQPNSVISRLVLNDVGTFIPLSAIQRLAEYVGQAPEFDDLHQVEQYLRIVAKPFGPLTDAQWQHLARYSAEETEQNQWQLRYDPAIAEAFSEVVEDIDISDIWQQVSCPSLIIRGAESDLLTEANAQQMLQRPHTQLEVVAGVGHAPMLMSQEQIALVDHYLVS